MSEEPKFTFVYLHNGYECVVSIKADTEEEASDVLEKIILVFDDWELIVKEPIIYDEEILEVLK